MGLALEFVTTRAEFSSQLMFRTLPSSFSMFGEKPLLGERERRLDRPCKTETCLRAVLLNCAVLLAHVCPQNRCTALIWVQKRGCLAQTRAQLNCVLYKHMKGHGPGPEVLEVVSKSHRHFLIWIYCWSVCPRAWNSLSAKQAWQEFQHSSPYNTQLICFKPDPQWSSPEKKVQFSLPPIQHSALDLFAKMGNQY